MDIPRPSNLRAKKIRRIAYGSTAFLLLGGATLGLSRLRPAPPSVDRATVYTDTVRRGEMLREVSGLGTLVPVDIRWIAAQSSARVDRIILQSGASVKPDSVILELSDPQLQRDVLDAEYAYKAAEADLANLKAQLANDLMAQKSAAAVIESDYQQASCRLMRISNSPRRGLKRKSSSRNRLSLPSNWASEKSWRRSNSPLRMTPPKRKSRRNRPTSNSSACSMS